MSLSSVVKEQGHQLSLSINKLVDSHNNSFAQLSDKINAVGKTDWTTFWTMVMTILLLLTAVSTPVWITFSGMDKAIAKQDKALDELRLFSIESIKDRAELRAEVTNNSKRILDLENAKRDSSTLR